MRTILNYIAEREFNQMLADKVKRLMIIDDNTVAEAMGYYNNVGDYYEVEIRVYRKGHRKDTDDGLLHGGRLSKEGSAGTLSILMQLFKKMVHEWKGLKLFTMPSDERRMRIYTKVLSRYHIPYKVAGEILYIFL